MEWTEAFKVVFAMVASVGGASAIILILSSWLVKVWGQRILARERTELHRLAVNTRGHLRSLNTGFLRAGADEDPIYAVRRPDDIVLFVAGGSGLYSAVFPSWAAGAHRNTVVRETVVTGESCELPWAVAQNS